MPSIFTKSPLPEAEMAPHTIILPPRCLTVGKRHSSFYLSPSFCWTYTLRLMYYIANQLLFLIKWIHINSDNEAWMDLEQYDCNDVKLSYLPFIGPSIKKHNCCKNKLISSTHLGGKLNITKYLMDPCIHSPIWYNPDFYIYKKTLFISVNGVNAA